MRNALNIKILLILLLIIPVSLSAYDFGLLINLNGGIGNISSQEAAFDFKIDVVPRFSTLIGDNGEFIATIGFSFGDEGEGLYYIPELLRTEFSMRFGNSGIRVGRIFYSDPLAFIANGLYDGFQYFNNSRLGSFRVGAWYTGFQYKKRANIKMSDLDKANYLLPVNYSDFADTYFASKRAFASIGWEHPSIGEKVHLNTAIIGQIDLNDIDFSIAKCHSEYIIIKAGIPIGNFLMEFGGSVEFIETVAEEANKFDTAFAGEIGLFWLFPSKFNSRLSFKGTIASGQTDAGIGAFIPITAKEYGYILKANIPGITVLSLNYSSKFSKTVGGSFTASYFVRNDLGTFNGYPVRKNSEGYFLGPEASAQVTWGPASDLQLSLGGGVFLPFLGDAGTDEKIKWRADLTVIMSIF